MKTYKEIFVRSSKPQDLGELLNEFYSILLLCESSELSNIKINSSSFTKSITNKVKLIHNHDIDHFIKTKIGKSERWILKPQIDLENLENEIYFVSGKSKFKKLLKHLRNAFAHNLIVIDKGYFVIGDFLLRKNESDFNSPTMLGRVSEENFKSLIESIKSLINNKQ